MDEISLLPGVNVLLMGPGGSGKTHSIGTLVETGVEVFFLGLEAGIEALFGYFTDAGKPIPKNLHWHILQLPQREGFAKMAQTANTIAKSSYQELCNMKDFERNKNNPYEKALLILNNFIDQRDGKSYGPADSWGPDRALVIDGNTGLGLFIMAMQVGVRPTKDKPDYGIVQDQMEKFIRFCVDGCKFHFVLICHIERETDETLGGTKIMPSCPGQKLSPKLSTIFSDVILAERHVDKWTWNTVMPLADLKTRNLTYGAKLEPDFKHIIDKWKSRGGKFVPSVMIGQVPVS